MSAEIERPEDMARRLFPAVAHVPLRTAVTAGIVADREQIVAALEAEAKRLDAAHCHDKASSLLALVALLGASR